MPLYLLICFWNTNVDDIQYSYLRCLFLFTNWKCWSWFFFLTRHQCNVILKSSYLNWFSVFSGFFGAIEARGAKKNSGKKNLQKIGFEKWIRWKADKRSRLPPSLQNWARQKIHLVCLSRTVFVRVFVWESKWEKDI